MHIINIILSDKFLPLIILILSPLAAFVVDFIFSFILKRFAAKTKNTFDDKLISSLHRPIFYSVLLIGWMIGFDKTNFQYSHYIISLLLSFIIIIWAKAVFQIFVESIKWYGKKQSRNKVLKQRMLPLFENLGKLFIFLFCTYFLLNSWGWDVTGWLASAGVIGIVFGLAAKDTLSNFFSGVFIMADAPYKENDYIILDSGERGYVSNIGLRSTRILTRDDIEITIPNSVIANSKIVNESGGPYEKERVRLNVGVAYGTDVDRVRQILTDIAINDELVSSSHTPRVRFREFGESSLLFQLLFWIDKPELRGRATDQINSKIYKTFSKENIEIPFPQRTIHIKKND